MLAGVALTRHRGQLAALPPLPYGPTMTLIASPRTTRSAIICALTTSRAASVLAVMSPNPTVEITVTVKYSASVRIALDVETAAALEAQLERMVARASAWDAVLTPDAQVFSRAADGTTP